MYLAIWIFSGILAGWLTGLVVKGQGYGLVGDLIIGLLGGIVGGWLFGLFGLYATSLIGNIIVAVVGGIVLVAVATAIPVKPNSAATTETIKKTIAQYSICNSFQKMLKKKEILFESLFIR